MQLAEPELLEQVSLCDEQGRLNRAAVGWSRQPLHTLNLRGRWGRKKRWNYWCITDGEFLFSVTLSSLDYVGAAFAYLWHRSTGEFIEQTVLRPLGRRCELPPIVDGTVRFDDARLSLQMARTQDRTHLEVWSTAFGGGPLAANLVVRHPANHESLNVVIPWNERTFQFTSKQHCLPTSGNVRWGDREYQFDADRTFACLDYGRGIWPYRTAWNWGACSAVQQGRTIGLNLGGQWTDGAGMTENGILVDGRLHKFGETLRFEHESDLMRPWRISSVDSNRIELKFVPVFDRLASSNLLVVASAVHQLLGYYTGHVVTNDGERLTLDGAFGWVEEHHARW